MFFLENNDSTSSRGIAMPNVRNTSDDELGGFSPRKNGVQHNYDGNEGFEEDIDTKFLTVRGWRSRNYGNRGHGNLGKETGETKKIKLKNVTLI
ncbi:hypothetical protein B9Z55_005684 [Caenorhabditis nigoni]|uniref:Uncharacterized protein n=1 Tax=Caenorhabditis nigoni TaxID=1611254 RepID=A0A2G5V1X3_9PELO|nr:hypothetical protein B9Z55_005684 [Caenorhabditis nigoni]